MILGIVVFVLVLAALVASGTILRNIYLCPPNEVLIFSGRRRPLPGIEGKREIGFRVVRGGRAMRIPLFEIADRMQLTNMAIELSVTNAFSRGGIPLNVQAVANVKIPSEEPLLHNALERFLGVKRDQIMLVAKDTLEGNLRGVIAELTPEEINQKKIMFQQKLIEEADRDMHRMGLVLDNLQIQNISDSVGYLTSVGRVRGAQVRRSAKIGEIRAHAAAQVQKAENEMAAELARIETDTQVARKEMERRIVEARTKREALVAEARGQVAAQIAEARAQLAAWGARIEQVRRRLEADIVAPAQARKQQAEANAKGQASQVLAQGRATAQALLTVGTEYKASGGNAGEALLLQKVVPIFEQLTATLNQMKVDRLTILGSPGNGFSAGSVAPSIVQITEQVRATTGVDLLSMVTGQKPSLKSGV